MSINTSSLNFWSEKNHPLSYTMCSTLCHAKLYTVRGLWLLFYRHTSRDLNRQMHSLPLLMLGPKSPKYSREESCIEIQTQFLPGAQRGAKGGSSILRAAFPRDGKGAGVCQQCQSGMRWQVWPP